MRIFFFKITVSDFYKLVFNDGADMKVIFNRLYVRTHERE